MGWNGRYQIWGACGYYHEKTSYGHDEHPGKCACGGEVLFANTADDTNGDEHGYVVPDLFPQEPHHHARWRTLPDKDTPRTYSEYLDPHNPDLGMKRIPIQ